MPDPSIAGPATQRDTAASGPQAALAVASLVLGILGMIAVPLIAPLAVLLGLIALIRIPRDPRNLGERGSAVIGLIFGIIGTLLLPVLVSRWREPFRRALCAENMKEIGLALMVYAHEFRDQGIPAVELLVEHGFLTANRLRCPSAPAGEASYVILNGKGDGLENDAVIIYEPLTNHGGEGGNFLFADGHASFIPKAQYGQTLSRGQASQPGKQ